MSGKLVKLGDCVKQYRNEILVDDLTNYGQITVSETGTISFRGIKTGKDIGRKRQFVLDLKTHQNTLIFTRQGIYNGAIGFAPPDTDGCIATENMPMFSLKPEISRAYIEQLLLSSVFKNEVKKLAPKGAAQKSIHERELLEIELPLPSIDRQSNIADTVAKKRSIVGYLQYEITHQQSLLGKLKQAILQEAIQGRLTADWRAANPGVEPASELLQRIQDEKARLIAKKKIRKEKPLPKITPEEIPFEIPDGWEWCRLNDLGYVGTGATPSTEKKAYYENGLIPWITSSATGKSFVHEPDKLITDLALAETNCSVYQKHTLLVAMYGQGKTRGQVTELMIAAATNQACAAIVIPQTFKATNKFAKLAMQENYEQIRKLAQGGSQPNLNLSKVKSRLIPLPPLAEQAAIVERVEALMATYHELEAEIASSRTHAADLLQAVLKEAFAPAS